MRFKFLFTLENEKFPIQYRKSIMSFIKMSLQEYNEETFDNQVYTLEEIKDILKIGRNSSYNLLNENYFKIIKLGKIVRISKKSFDNWLNK